jgi:transposase
MGRPTSTPQREVIYQRAGLGHRSNDIADDLGLNRETVRKLIARFRKAGPSSISADYSRCGASQPNRADAELIEAAIAMRREHPTWGAVIIRVQLAEQHPDRTIPSERVIQRAFVAAKVNPAPAGRRRDGPGRRAKEPHETWQMDAADQMKLAGGEMASWLRIVDECSGAVLATVVFPPGVLEYRAGLGDPGGSPGSLHAVGPTGANPRGQWHAVEVKR